ncbi:hypothetical protein O9G_000544 [Rozella allomycis CSF55]|uniref:NAA35-like TPR repeats domain-containing protein n=1 Tax=Rozella allomycis (strain CSF55) TaxID=988480 RepID=A0A075AW25_ROZAC|nr:hypothetical protein O9G_000544 [Rozella allomycis CSF55]|eukprot:EPZ34357.1 hypothetical protein O9G_000544 [Rozella allomycis CSF55]
MLKTLKVALNLLKTQETNIILSKSFDEIIMSSDDCLACLEILRQSSTDLQSSADFFDLEYPKKFCRDFPYRSIDIESTENTLNSYHLFFTLVKSFCESDFCDLETLLEFMEEMAKQQHNIVFKSIIHILYQKKIDIRSMLLNDPHIEYAKASNDSLADDFITKAAQVLDSYILTFFVNKGRRHRNLRKLFKASKSLLDYATIIDSRIKFLSKSSYLNNCLQMWADKFLIKIQIDVLCLSMDFSLYPQYLLPHANKLLLHLTGKILIICHENSKDKKLFECLHFVAKLNLLILCYYKDILPKTNSRQISLSLKVSFKHLLKLEPSYFDLINDKETLGMVSTGEILKSIESIYKDYIDEIKKLSLDETLKDLKVKFSNEDSPGSVQISRDSENELNKYLNG